MEAFNAEPNVREQRESAYADRYVTVIPSGPLRGLRLEQGGELHHDDGTIIRLGPGDWVVEQPDGRMTGINAEVFAKAYAIDEGAEDVGDQIRATRQQLGQEAPAPSVAPEEPPTPTASTIKEQIEQAHRDVADRVKLWADSAYDAELISHTERSEFIATNEFPEGLTVKEEHGQWVLSREGGNDIGSLDLDQGQEGPKDWTEETRNDIVTELQRRGVELKANVSKAKALEVIQRSEVDMESGGTGEVPVLLDTTPEPQRIVGADTPETAAREPHAQQQDPVDPDPNPDEGDDDGRRPGGETRTSEDGEVQGAREIAQAKETAHRQEDPQL